MQDKEQDEIEEIATTHTALTEDMLVEHGFAESKSDAKRLFEQGAITLNGEKITSGTEVTNGAILKVGKRTTVRLTANG